MDDYYKTNKSSNLYWLKQLPNDIKIKIRIKPREGTVVFPKFKEFANNSDSLQILNHGNIEDHILTWQEKKFSRFEINQYADRNYCNTDLDLKYHGMVINKDYAKPKIFTHTHADGILPLSQLSIESRNSTNKSHKILNLISFFTKLSFCAKLKSNATSEDMSNSTNNLFKREDNLSSGDEEWKSMHILWDNSEYNENSQLLFKDVCILVSLHYNESLNQLIVSPDVNNLEYNSYSIESSAGVLAFEYSVDLEFKDHQSTVELNLLLGKLKKKLDKKQKNLFNFIMPHVGKHKVCVMFEIVSTEGFDMDNIYIDFNMKVSGNMKCIGSTSFHTHVSSAIETNERKTWNYGHLVDFEFEYESNIDPSPPKIFFEVISTDWWGRHRTEGYTYLTLSLKPGHHSRHLSCSRPEEIDSVEAENRRFFVGGCHLIKDFNVLENPQLHKTNFRYTSTGTILVRWNTLVQAHAHVGSMPTVVHASGTELLRRADDVLRNYQCAKAKLAAATRERTPIDGSRDG